MQDIEGIRYTKHRSGNIRQRRCPQHKGGGNANQTRIKVQNTEEVGMKDREGIGTQDTEEV